MRIEFRTTSEQLSAKLKEILFYYHRKGRAKMKKRIPDGYFDDFPEAGKAFSTVHGVHNISTTRQPAIRNQQPAIMPIFTTATNEEKINLYRREYSFDDL